MPQPHTWRLTSLFIHIVRVRLTVQPRFSMSVYRYSELFEHLLATDRIHNVVGVLCYLQSVTESLSAAVATLSASASVPDIVLPLWTSVVAALQDHLNTVSCFSMCNY